MASKAEASKYGNAGVCNRSVEMAKISGERRAAASILNENIRNESSKAASALKQ
jgi:hypothetical protein